MLANLAALAVDTAFDKTGHPAVYAPPEGEGVACRILFSADNDTSVDFGGTGRPVGRRTVIRVRKSEVAAPVKGQTIAVTSGETYRIVSEPRFKDTARLVWSFEADAQ